MNELATSDAAKALIHPLRAQILERLAGREASPLDLAVELDEKLGNVSYHVRALHKLGAIRLVRTRQVRGALAHYYTAAYKLQVVQKPI